MNPHLALIILGLIALVGVCVLGGRRLELGAAALAGLACLATGIVGAFRPLSTSTTCTSTATSSATHCVTVSQSVWQQGDYGAAVFAVILGLVGAAILAGSAYLHARMGLGFGLATLWTFAVLLAFATILGAASFGIFTLLPALFTLIAATAGTVDGFRSRTTAAT